MTVARSVADVLADHVVFEVECIDRMYCNVYVPQLQHAGGLLGYVQRQLGLPIASTAPLAKITDAFSAAMRRFARDQQVPWVDFVKGQRKDDVMHEHLAGFTRDFGIGKRLTNLPALREIGLSANRRLLGAQRLSHNPIRAGEAFTAVHDPIITDTGARIAGLRLGDRRAHALLQALLVFRLLPNGFVNRDLRALLADLLGHAAITAGQMSYDLRRLRAHGLITRIPRSHRYRLTDTGLHHAMLLDHAHTRLLLPGPAQLTDPDPLAPSTLRTAARNYRQALDQLTQEAGLAA